MEGFLFWIVTAIIVGIVAARVWQSKGGDFWQGFFLGFLLHLLGLFFVAFAVPNTAPPMVGQAIKTRRRINLDNGSRLPADYLADVIAVDNVGGTPIVNIKSPTGSTHWIAARDVRPAQSVAPSASATKVCPRCAEAIKAEATVCRYCGHEFSSS